jgi:Carboxypeptidase regulatory-like domain
VIVWFPKFGVAPALIAGLCTVSALAQIGPPLATGVNGSFRTDNGQPIPGALVAVYQSDSNILVDATYSTDTGAFALKKPPQPGAYYVVATKDSLAARAPLKWTAGVNGVFVPLTSPHEKPLAILTRGLTPLAYLCTAALGFFTSWFTRFLDDRRRFRQQMAYVRNHYTALLAECDSLMKFLQELKDTPVDAPKYEQLKQQCETCLKSMEAPLRDLEAERVDPAAMYAARGDRGYQEQQELRTTILQIREFINLGCRQFILLPEDEQDDKLRCFKSLKTASLFQERSWIASISSLKTRTGQ